MPSPGQAQAETAVFVGVTQQKRETETETERRPRDPTTICRTFDLSHIRRPDGLGPDITLRERVGGWKRPLALQQKAAAMTPRLNGELQK